MANARIPATENQVAYSYHIYIEAQDIKQNEYLVFKRLFPLFVEIHPFKGKKSLKAAAQAFSETYPNWLFVIDRDYTSSETVEKTWQEFPEKRLLIWRKRCIENYFLKPGWLTETSLLKKKSLTAETIWADLTGIANKHLLQDALFYVFHQQDETLKRSFFESSDYKCYERFTDLTQLDSLISQYCPSSIQRANNAYQGFCTDFRQNFFQHLSALAGETISTDETGNIPALQQGKGLWPDLMNGKTLWSDLCSHYGLQSKPLLESLFSSDPKFFPEDFIELRNKVAGQKR
jgi:hypothetical protein